ncbi:MAG: arsenate reductase [Acidobacteria bacterium]|nr:arsenate reductase [Acidobacteriota bacterium]
MKLVQIFGVKNSSAARAAERFFKERGVPIQYVDLKQKALAPGEIKRFIDKYKLSSMFDVESKEYEASGLKYMRMSESDLLAKIEKEPKLLKLPLVRHANLVSIGHDEESWKAMAAALKEAARK